MQLLRTAPLIQRPMNLKNMLSTPSNIPNFIVKRQGQDNHNKSLLSKKAGKGGT